MLTERHGLGLNAAQQVKDSSTLQPNLVVKKPAELLRQQPDGCLGPFACIDPIEMQMTEAPVMFTDVLDRCETIQKLGELSLSLVRQEEVEKRLEAAALVESVIEFLLPKTSSRSSPFEPAHPAMRSRSRRSRARRLSSTSRKSASSSRAFRVNW
jgi:hypothetical protein